VPVGGTAYTALLNARGTFESDVTVARLSGDSFLIVTGTAQAARDADWIRRHVPDEARATLTDVTSAYAVIAVMGPRSRELLSRVSRADFGNAAFPFGAIREVDIGYATVWASRRTYVGELGWELFVPTEFAATVYDSLIEAGAAFGLVDAGYYAIESLRLEKSYRAWGRELTPDYTPWEAGLGFAVRLDKGDFLGRAALVAAKAKPLTRRCVSLVARDADAPLAHGGELVLRDGRPVGEVTSAGFGAATSRVVALAYVSSEGAAIDPAWLEAGRFELEIAGVRAPVRASLKASYDPSSARTRM
jgi:4-methylaminobutanoate oxidase (formaldehyde-forming)